MVGNGARYLAITVTELFGFKSSQGLPGLLTYDAIPELFSHYGYWQCGTAEHSNSNCKILGSPTISCQADLGNPSRILHLVLECSSQRLIPRNVMQACNILHINDKHLYFCLLLVTLTICQCMMKNLYATGLLYQCAKQALASFTKCSGLSGSFRSYIVLFNIITHSTSNLTRIISGVHNHVCGYASYGALHTLLQRSNIRNTDLQRILSTLFVKCHQCIAAALPAFCRKVSTAKITCHFENVVGVDNFILVISFHSMLCIPTQNSLHLCPYRPHTCSILASLLSRSLFLSFDHYVLFNAISFSP